MNRFSLVFAAVLLAGCLSSGSTITPEASNQLLQGMQELRIDAATFEGAMVPFLVELPNETKVRLAMANVSFGGDDTPHGAIALVPESQWGFDGSGCNAFLPTIDTEMGVIAEAQVPPGRYVVASIGFGEGHVSFNDGPVQPWPYAEGAGTTGGGWTSNFVHVGVNGRSVDVEAWSLARAFAKTTPRDRELLATDQLEVLVDGELCHNWHSDIAGEERGVSLWMMLRGFVEVRHEATAVPLPPESAAGFVHGHWDFTSA